MNIYIGASSGDIIGFLHTEADFSGDYKAQSAKKVYKIECKGQEPHQNNQCVFVFEVRLFIVELKSFLLSTHTNTDYPLIVHSIPYGFG